MRIFIFCILLFNLSFSNNHFDTQILKSNPSINFENIQKNDAFKNIEFPLVKKGNESNYWIKLNTKPLKNTHNNKLLKIHSMFGINDIKLDKNIERFLIDTNTIEIVDGLPNIIYFKIVNIQNNINVELKIYDKKSYVEGMILKNKLYGLAQGIPFTAFLYYMLFYAFNRKKSSLYYSLTQVFTAGILVLSQQSNYLPYDFISTGFVVFSMLFTQEFLQTKKYLPFIHKLFYFLIVLFTLDMFLPISDYFPISFFMLLYLISGVMVYYKTKQKQVLVYLLAWGLIVLVISIVTIQIYLKDFLPYDIDLVDTLHILMPLESIILAFALSYSMKLSEEEKLEKEKLLVHQNKLASLGEMISNIAHQWRQPLTHLNYIFMNLNKAHEHNKLDTTYLSNKSKEAKEQLQYMSNTIDIFKDFYTPKTDEAQIDVKQEIENTLQIISATLKKEKVEVNVSGDSFNTYGFQGELSQVFLNLITNAKDALINNEIQNPIIDITLKDNSINVCDNAGGIDDEVVKDIFNPYFTTKEEGNGIGLYMSKLIVENHFSGKLIYEKLEDKSIFTIELNLKK